MYTHVVGDLFARSVTANVIPPYLLLVLALVGGAASFFSPCSVALTPSFLAYFAGVQRYRGAIGHLKTLAAQLEVDGKSSVVHGYRRLELKTSIILVLGILSFYASAGILVGWLGVLVYNYLIYFIPAMGAVFIGLGYVVLTGRSVGFLGRLERINPANRYYNDKIHRGSLPAPTKSKGDFSTYIFGLSYGAASHSCTLPIFLGVVLVPLASGSYWLAGATVFVYGAAIAALFVLMLMLGRNTVAGFYRHALGRHLQWVTGGLFMVTDSYLLLYFVQNYGGLIL